MVVEMTDAEDVYKKITFYNFSIGNAKDFYRFYYESHFSDPSAFVKDSLRFHKTHRFNTYDNYSENITLNWMKREQSPGWLRDIAFVRPFGMNFEIARATQSCCYETPCYANHLSKRQLSNSIMVVLLGSDHDIIYCCSTSDN